MKQLLLILLFLFAPGFIFGQSNKDKCGRIVETVYDKVEQKTTKRTKKMIFVSTSTSVMFLNFSKVDNGDFFFMVTTSASSSCMMQGDKIVIFFKDQTKIELGNSYETSCGTVRAVAGFSKSVGNLNELELLKTKPIELVRVYTDKGYIDGNFKDSQSQNVLDAINCILQ